MPRYTVTLTRQVITYRTATFEVEADNNSKAVDVARDQLDAGEVEFEDDPTTRDEGPVDYDVSRLGDDGKPSGGGISGRWDD